jgi:hypothetical protein
VLGLLSRGLDAMPVVLSQQADVIAFAGQGDADLAKQIAQHANEGWQQGATDIAREYIRFQEETFSIGDKRLTLLLYSRHITDALVLTVGWQIAVSLTQIRAEMSDARLDLLDALHEYKTDTG